MQYLRTIIITITLLLSFSSLADNKLIPLEVYAQRDQISLMAISPDGSRFAYRTYQNDKEVLLIKDIATGKMLGGTSLSGLDAEILYFIDNFRVIFRASKYQKIPGFRGMHNLEIAFIYDMNSQTTRQLLIPGFGIFTGQTNMGGIIGLSEDKSVAYMPAYTEINPGGSPSYSVMKVKLDSKRKPRQMNIAHHDAIDFFVDENGEPLVRELFNAKDKLHRVQSYIDGSWVDIFTHESPFRHHGFSGLTPDRKSLVMTKTGENGRRQFYTMSLKDGAISEPIFVNDDADIEHVLTNLQRIVYGVQYSGFKPSYAFFSKNLTKNFAAIQAAMPEVSFILQDHTSNWSHIIFKLEGGQQAGEYILFANNSFKYLEASRPQINAAMVNPVSEYNYSARDGLNIPTLLTYPNGKKKHKLPAIIMPHGGPESYDTIGFHWLAQYYASRGVLVVQPQFRGSEGFGADHVLAGRGEWGKKIQDDITDSVTALTKENIIDPDRVCIMGWSYGGYAALAGATFTPDLYKCVISVNGIGDVVEMLDELNEDSEAYNYWQEVINKKNLDNEFLKSISPINHVKNVKAPVLLIHGQRDQIVDIDQSEEMFDELEDADKEVTFIEIRGDNHYLLKYESRIKTLKAIDDFLQKHLF